MTHGPQVEEEEDHRHYHNHAVSPDAYARGIARVAVAQLCLEALGLRATHRSVVDSLSDVAVNYVRDLGRSAKSHSESSGRSEPNALDVLAALEDLSLFPSPAMIRDLATYLRVAAEVPFAWPVPRFPIPKVREVPRSFARAGEAPPVDHVPPWLPALPEPHTYSCTRDLGEEEMVAAEREVDRVERAKQRRRAEKALLSLERRLADAGRGRAGAPEGGNGFVEPRVRFGDREVPVVPREASLEPVIEAVRRSGTAAGVANGWRDESPRWKRCEARFRFGFDRWTLSPAVPLAPAGGADRWVAREEERNEKKRRAAAILRESVENPHELLRF